MVGPPPLKDWDVSLEPRLGSAHPGRIHRGAAVPGTPQCPPAVHRHCFGHTKPISRNNSFTTPTLWLPGCCCLRQVIHSKKEHQSSPSKYPCPGGAGRGLQHQHRAVTPPHTAPPAQTPARSCHPSLPASQQGCSSFSSLDKHST